MRTGQSCEADPTCEMEAGQAPGHVEKRAVIILVEEERERLGHDISGAGLVVRHG